MSKATELADKLEEDPSMWGGLSKVAWPAAGELRRLDAENAAMRQRVAELEQQLAARVPDVEALADKIAEGLRGTYHCLRVWAAWHVGTMGKDDFEPVDESETPREIAESVIAMLEAAPQPVAQPEQGRDEFNRRIRDSTDALLEQAGYAADSSARHGLSCMNFDTRPKTEPVAQPEQKIYLEDGPDWNDQFEAWWDSHGQFCRAGGGGYEKTFAFRAWEAASKPVAQPERTGCTAGTDEACTNRACATACPALSSQPEPAVQGEPVYQCQAVGDGRWTDQTRESYEYNARHASDKTRVLYTRPQPERVALTVKEIVAFVGTHEFGPEHLKWFRFGEAAHGIKRGTP